MDIEQQTNQLKKEERWQKKEDEHRAGQRERRVRQFRKYIIIAVVTAAIVYGLYFIARNIAPKGDDFSRAIPVMEASHMVSDSPPPTYNSNPPTSGPHYGQTAQSGFRKEIITDQYIIHNLEHGDIWISYNPRVTDEIKEELKQFAAAKVIITPREANDADITLAAWGRLDSFNVENNALPINRVKDFIKRYINRGPEKVPGASGGI